MKKASVVIGANFGDEGKGLMTDFLGSKLKGEAVVVRFNGGAQAGHTVTAPDGRRHVFNHFSSGSFCGATTFLSEFFVINPILFHNEAARLDELGLSPRVIVDPDCPLTTPYDMLINQIIEDARGDGRHGSCGVGFGETIERNLRAEFKTVARDLASPAVLLSKLDLIRSSWVPERLAALGISEPFGGKGDLFRSDALRDRFLTDCRDFSAAVKLIDLTALDHFDHVVFEGAQGLLLDQDHRWFPHVTRSSTGLRNVCVLALKAGITDLDVVYATRAYLTRHGAGPLPHALDDKPFAGIVDRTNIPNAYQGALRFAWLDLDLLASTIRDDLEIARGKKLSITPFLAVSCVDQVDRTVPVVRNGVIEHVSRENIARHAIEAVGLNSGWESRGASRNDIRKVDSKNDISLAA